MDLSTTKVLLISLHLKTKHDVYTMAFLHTICLTHWICCRCTPGTIPLFRGISSLGGLDKLRASEPASHASQHASHASHARQIPSPFSFLRLLAAFGNLARVFAILTLLSVSFCYLPSYFSSFFYGKLCYLLLFLTCLKPLTWWEP